MRESALASFAIAYGGCGFRVFPLRPGEKIPLQAGWRSNATRDERRLRAMFADEDRNIGAVTGEAFDVFDVEAEHVEAVAEFIGGWPSAPRSRSGRGGIHVFVRPVGVGGTRRLVLDGMHVGELKSRGGLVVLPPSTTTGTYRWEECRSGLVPGVAPAKLVDLVVERLPTTAVDGNWQAPAMSAHRAARILGGLVRTVAEAPEGERNARLFWAACRVREHGLPATVALPELESAAIGVGLGEREIAATIRSAAHA